MAAEFGTDQLVEFCARLGLAKDGYLDEKGLALVCNCLGLQAPEEMLKELFEELDTDKDGRVCLDELSAMLRGMSKGEKPPATPEKRKSSADLGASPSTPINIFNQMGATSSLQPSLHSADRSFFSILDPQNSGFTKVGLVLDMWAQWGVRAEDGSQILRDLGFPSISRSSSINVGDLTKALEEEMDNAKDTLPLLVQTALLTCKTETQYLRSICEGMEEERDKLRSDVLEAHQRSSLLAQEVDEQNARLEKNSQLLLQKMEAKYTEQIHELHQKFAFEKDTLQQALILAESQLKALQGDDSKLKEKIVKLNEENATLEHELQNLNKEIQDITKTKDQLEREITKYVDFENKLVDMERCSGEKVALAEAKLQQAYMELQELRDRNDELSTQVETLREKMKTFRNMQDKRHYYKRRKGSGSGAGPESSGSKSLDGFGVMEVEHSDSEYPVEKIGKYLTNEELEMLQDVEDADPTSLSPNDSGNFPVTMNATFLTLGACMGETSTDSPAASLPPTTLEREMETVKSKIESIVVQHQQCLKNELERSGNSERRSVESQTEINNNNYPGDTDVVMEDDKMAILTAKVEALETEKLELKTTCTQLESSIELLREEYEKCEDYWQDKLHEARDMYEQDKLAMDEKFQDLLDKIKEYDEAFSPPSPSKLPVIDERASLEQQVNELEEECEGLRKELRSIKVEQDSVFSHYQRQWEARAMEECNRLELQISALTKKCQDYENRLSSLAEEEKGTLEEGKMIESLRNRVKDLEQQLKVQEESHREELSKIQASSTVSTSPKTEVTETIQNQLSRSPSQSSNNSFSPVPPEFRIWSNNCNENNNNIDSPQDWKEKSKSLLELLHQQAKVGQEQPKEAEVVSPYLIWPQRYSNAIDARSSSSLPFLQPVPPKEPLYFPVSNNMYPIQPQPMHPPPPFVNAWNSQSQPPPPGPRGGEPWMYPYQNGNGKKAWCHVEVGWLQALRCRLKQREEQCIFLQRALQKKDFETERIIQDMRCKQDAENAKWEQVLREMERQHTEKLLHSETIVQNVCSENSQLVQKIGHLENLLKYHLNLQQQGLTNVQNMTAAPNAPKSLPFPFHANF